MVERNRIPKYLPEFIKVLIEQYKHEAVFMYDKHRDTLICSVHLHNSRIPVTSGTVTMFTGCMRFRSASAQADKLQQIINTTSMIYGYPHREG